jgi:hypothetical protein
MTDNTWTLHPEGNASRWLSKPGNALVNKVAVSKKTNKKERDIYAY